MTDLILTALIAIGAGLIGTAVILVVLYCCDHGPLNLREDD